MESLPKVVREKDLKTTFQIILTDLEQAQVKNSQEWKLTDQILGKMKTAENHQEWEVEISQNDFSYANYLGVLRKEVNELISLLFKQLVSGSPFSFTYENKEVKQSLNDFAKWLEQEESRAEINRKEEL
jgi:molecular chaperone DnaK (HSP70)